MLERNGDQYIRDGKWAVIPTRDQDFLATIYLRMKSEKLLEVMFYEEQPDLCRFMSLMLADGEVVLGLFQIESTGLYTLIGFGGISKPVNMGNGYNKSEMFCLFFKEFQKRHVTIPVAQTMMAWVYERSTVDVMFGTTPAPNIAMVRFAKALGFKLSKIDNFTTWKGDPCAAWISCMSEEEWKATAFAGETAVPPIGL